MRDLVKKRFYENSKRKFLRDKWLDENGPCINCGSNLNLEIDHIDRKTKISHRVWTWSEKRRLEELKKCQVLCKSCHVKKTANDLVTKNHGTEYRYSCGCRCDLCTSAKTVAVNNYRWKNGLRKKRKVQNGEIGITADC